MNNSKIQAKLNNENSTNIEYSKQVVFFIDILAFKNLIQGKDKRTASDIALILKRINHFVDDETFGKDCSKTVTQFSDSVILSFNYDKPSGLFYSLLDILHLQFELFHSNNVLVRGACYIGNAYHDNEFCFGEAINEAYLLQEKCAIYPRIIISEEIIKQCAFYSIHLGYNEEADIKEILKQDTDGYWYVDYFSYDVLYTEMDEPEYWGCYMQKIRGNIMNGLTEQNISIRQKYLWLKDKYNNALTDLLIKRYKENFDVELKKIP